MKAKVIVAVVAVFLAGWMAGTARAEDFSLPGIETLMVNKAYGNGTLYDQSKAWVVPGGSVYSLKAYSTSTVNISGGQVKNLKAYDTSTVDISGGEVTGVLSVYDTSTVNVSGGEVYYLITNGSSTVNISDGQFSSHFIADQGDTTFAISGGQFSCNFTVQGDASVAISGGQFSDFTAQGDATVAISGGQFSCNFYAQTASTVDISGGQLTTVDISGGQVNCSLHARGTGVLTFHGQDFILGTGLWLNGDEVLGTGILSGKWFDDTPWTVTISENTAGATILAVPEPATLSLLTLGGLAVLRRRRMA